MSDTPRTINSIDLPIDAQAMINALYAEKTRLERELAECRKDAERYRWLRDGRLSANINFAMTMGWKPELLSCDQIDAAIDGCIIAESIDAVIKDAAK